MELANFTKLSYQVTKCGNVDTYLMDEDILSIKKRLETKIRETRHELKEFSREKDSQVEIKLTNEIGRLDLRMRSLERLIWNRLSVLLIGIILGIMIAVVGFLLIKYS